MTFSLPDIVPLPPAASQEHSGPRPLDTYCHNCTASNPWCKCKACRREIARRRRRGRGYHRAMSGLRFPGTVVLITLTTSSRADALGMSIQVAWRAYMARLRRRGWVRGYFRVREYTHAGRAHYHVMARIGKGVTPAILQKATSAWWSQIFYSPVVDVRKVSGRIGIAKYLVKYLGKDENARYSTSRDWLWSGAGRDWAKLVGRGLRAGIGLEYLVAIWLRIVDSYACTGKWLDYHLGGVCYGFR